MYTISKMFTFEASHWLPHVPEGHPCRRLHGHSYRVQVVLQSPILEGGFVVDFNDLNQLRAYLDEHFDHHHLNDIFLNPTAEKIAEHLYFWCAERWPQTIAVRVSETAKTWAEYRNLWKNEHDLSSE